MRCDGVPAEVRAPLSAEEGMAGPSSGSSELLSGGIGEAALPQTRQAVATPPAAPSPAPVWRAIDRDSFSIAQAAPAGPAAEPPAPALQGARRAGRVALLLLAVAACLALLGLLFNPAFRTALRGSLLQGAPTLYRTLVTEFFLNPWFYGVLAGVVLLERLLPAAPGRPVLAEGVRIDFAWVFLKLFLHAWVLPLYLVALRFAYDHYLGWLTIHRLDGWPRLGRILVALLVGDLVFWVTHVVRHKVSYLWYFHAVHHSQKELNFFTEYRVHPIDDVFLFTIGFVPIFMVDHSFIDVVAIVWTRHWHTRFYHSNIRTNLGPLRYLLVTPQSHRVHHSVEPRHHDKNFGLTFSLWDQLFGTQYRGYDEYPETGINDHAFPHEQAADGGRLTTLIEQLVYPFRAIARSGPSG